MISYWHLKHEVYVPQQTIDRFIRASNSMKENGLFVFFESFFGFWFRIQYGDVDKREDNFQPINSDEIYNAMFFLIYQLLFAFIVLIFEIIWFHAERRYQRFLNQWNECIAWLLLK